MLEVKSRFRSGHRDAYSPAPRDDGPSRYPWTPSTRIFMRQSGPLTETCAPGYWMALGAVSPRSGST